MVQLASGRRLWNCGGLNVGVHFRTVIRVGMTVAGTIEAVDNYAQYLDSEKLEPITGQFEIMDVADVPKDGKHDTLRIPPQQKRISHEQQRRRVDQHVIEAALQLATESFPPVRRKRRRHARVPKSGRKQGKPRDWARSYRFLRSGFTAQQLAQPRRLRSAKDSVNRGAPHVAINKKCPKARSRKTRSQVAGKQSLSFSRHCTRYENRMS